MKKENDHIWLVGGQSNSLRTTAGGSRNLVPFFVICLAAVAMAGEEDPSDEGGGGNDEYQVRIDMDYDNETQHEPQSSSRR